MRQRIPGLVAKHPIAGFLVLTLLISWTCVVAYAAGQAGRLGHEPSILWLALVGQFGPAYAALLMVGIRDGRRGVANLLSGIRRVRIGWGPGVVVLLHVPGALGLAVVVDRLLDGEPLPLADVPWGRAAAVLVGAAAAGMVFGGLSEEPGWRGYLLPRLQERFSAVSASVVIGAVWALWHLEPAFVAEGMQSGWTEFLSRWARYQSVLLPEAIALALIMTAIYNRTRGSLFAVMLLHAVHNAFLTAMPDAWQSRLAVSAGEPVPDLRIHFIASLWAVALLVWWSYRGHGRIRVDERGRLPQEQPA